MKLIKAIFGFVLLVFAFGPIQAQDHDHNDHDENFIEGIVLEKNESNADQKELPLIAANVYWLGTNVGVATDLEGHFKIKKVEGAKQLEVSYVGYKTAVYEVEEGHHIKVQLESEVMMEEVEVVHKKKSTEVSYLNPLKTENIGEKELLKGACCNLSESFETSPSVDVSFTDAVTGTRQIQMLGLSGPYTQITRENMPSIRGLTAVTGLTYVPGTWIESIQLNKGTGTVVNGFESIAGQINVELRKPEEAERVYLNLYANEGGRLEANANFAHRFKDKKWSTALLLHAKKNTVENDRNNDSFLDNPLTNQFIGINRWKYIGEKNLRAQFGVKATLIENVGGQVGFDPNKDILTDNVWGMQQKVNRLEGWAKIALVFPKTPWRSVAIQMSGVNHEQENYFGLTNYDADQKSLYANLIYQGILGNTNHGFKTGLSFQYDDYRQLLNKVNYNFVETIPGAYFEYSFNKSDKFNMVAGIRADHHNAFGAFVTPRLHMRYAISDNTVIRASGGRGQRTANVISENMGMLASNRFFNIHGDSSDKPYGLEAEVAWNYGINLNHEFQLDYRAGRIGVDFYRTNFENQIVVDLDQNPQEVHFYNLDGQSFSNSFQIQLDYELLKRVDVRLAYRWYDVKTTYDGELLNKPFVASNRAFLNVGYETRDNWKFDATLNWQGQKRIPFTGSNPVEFQLPENSPSFVQMNTQVSKGWKDQFEIYVGAENLLNFRQDNPILAASEPFGDYFDSSLIWGPVFGRNIYMGLRYRLK